MREHDECKPRGHADTETIHSVDSHSNSFHRASSAISASSAVKLLLLLRAFSVLSVFSVVNVPVSASDFATAVINFTPAPGQFINDPNFSDPSRAIGPPAGGGLFGADNSKLVSLGGFGGSITLAFSAPVTDDPLNPWGLDAIVYSNAFYAGTNPNRRFAEAAVIEIARDANHNALADDPWFLIRAPGIPATPNSAQQSQLWDDNPSTPAPPANLDWYPAAPAFPAWPASYITTTIRLPSLFEVIVLQNPLGLSATLESHYALADLSPTLLLGDTNADDTVDNPAINPADFYTAPDNPFVVGVTPGSGGGDSFDIAWAVDAATGALANLPSFDFIRITTAVHRVDPLLGEMSSEISAVADVRPRASFYDLNTDTRLNAEDLYTFERTPVDLTGEQQLTPADRAALLRALRANEPTDVSATR